MNYAFLKSGTDVRGIASDLGGKAVQLTDEAVYDIVSAFAVWLKAKTGKDCKDLTVGVGHDSRITADRISNSTQKALTDAGVRVLDCDLCSTPAMFMTTIDLNTDAAVQITASHHPFDRNGLKFFLPSGGLDGSDLSEILAIAENEEKIVAEEKGTVEKVNYLEMYAARLRKMICEAVEKTEADQPLKGYHIIVDAGNGAGGFYATDVLAPLGADVSGSQFLDPDGMFPNHIPNPEDKTAMESICNAVLKNNADLGLIFDTDVDRAGCVGADGKEINRNRLIALSSYIALSGNEGGTIVTDSVTSDGLKTFIESDLGSVHYRYRRGYKNVINKALELCEQGINCPLAIETSGHAALRENYFLDDGAYLVTKIVIELAKGNDIAKIIESLELPLEEREYRLNIREENFKDYGLKVIRELEEYCNRREDLTVADDNREGVRVSTKNGWFLLRLSVHDPVMPLNFESRVAGGIDEDVKILQEFLKDYTGFETLPF